MSWLFGSKKSKTVTPQTITAEVSGIDIREDDDFVLVNNDVNRAKNVNDPPPMYPLIPGAAPSGSNQSNGTQQSSKNTQPLHQLHGVPFRLSKDTSLLLSMTQDSHNFVLQQAKAAITNVDQSAFKYDFAVEKSVLKETQDF